MYKISESLYDKFVEILKKDTDITNDGSCKYCAVEEDFLGKKKHEMGCEGKDMLDKLNKLEPEDEVIIKRKCCCLDCGLNNRG